MATRRRRRSSLQTGKSTGDAGSLLRETTLREMSHLYSQMHDTNTAVAVLARRIRPRNVKNTSETEIIKVMAENSLSRTDAILALVVKYELASLINSNRCKVGKAIEIILQRLADRSRDEALAKKPVSDAIILGPTCSEDSSSTPKNNGKRKSKSSSQYNSRKKARAN